MGELWVSVKTTDTCPRPMERTSPNIAADPHTPAKTSQGIAAGLNRNRWPAGKSSAISGKSRIPSADPSQTPNRGEGIIFMAVLKRMEAIPPISPARTGRR